MTDKPKFLVDVSEWPNGKWEIKASYYDGVGCYIDYFIVVKNEQDLEAIANAIDGRKRKEN